MRVICSYKTALREDAASVSRGPRPFRVKPGRAARSRPAQCRRRGLHLRGRSKGTERDGWIGHSGDFTNQNGPALRFTPPGGLDWGLKSVGQNRPIAKFTKRRDTKKNATRSGRLKPEGAKQQNLAITSVDEPEITVDNIEVAQFIYFLLHNQKIRDVIDTIGKKRVLLLVRSSPG